MRIAFIGGGIMGEAMVRCLLTTGVAGQQDIVVSDLSPARRELLSKECGVSVFGDNGNAIDSADLVALVVKPRDIAQVLEEIRGNLSSKQLVLSIVAGASLSSLCQGLNHSSVVRAMPNMPAQIGEGMTVWTATLEVSKEQKDMAQSVLGALGEEIYVPEEKYLDMATALSGSGPAYVFLFIEALIDAGVHLGFSRDIAHKLVIKTILGSTHALQKIEKHPAELRNMVTSPAGTTTEALLHLEKGGFRSLLLEAVAAAYNKAKHL